MTKMPDSIEFSSCVMKAFEFLAARYGFVLSAIGAAPRKSFVLSAIGEEIVEFTNGDLKVEVFREPGSFLICVQVSCISNGEIFVLHEILKALVPEKRLTAQCSGREKPDLLNCLNHLSQICQENLDDILSGDKAALEKVASSARKDRKAYTLECQFGPTRDRANLAWDRKEWDIARQLYQESLPILSTAEKRRLDFLIKNSSASTE